MIAFTDLLAPGRPPDTSGVVPLAEARPGVSQVDLGLGFKAVSDLDGLAGIESVRSVINGWTVRARVPLPQVRELMAVETDAETLRNLPNLEALILRDPVDVEAVPPGLRMLGVHHRVFGGLEALERFGSLERLRVGAAFLGSAEPLGRLTSLRWLSADIGKGLRGLGTLTGLEELYLAFERVSPADVKALSGLTALRRLKLDGAIQSLTGIESMRALEWLHLYAPLVGDLTPLAGLPALAEVRIDQPRKLSDPSALGELPALRHLRYQAGTMTRLGSIPTLGFLRDHPALETLELIHTAVADGDYSALDTLPRLRSADVESGRRAPEPPYRQLKTGTWSIFRDVTTLLDVPDNHEAEERVRAALDPELADRLTFDSEAGALGITAQHEEDIRAAAAVIDALRRR